MEAVSLSLHTKSLQCCHERKSFVNNWFYHSVSRLQRILLDDTCLLCGYILYSLTMLPWNVPRPPCCCHRCQPALFLHWHIKILLGLHKKCDILGMLVSIKERNMLKAIFITCLHLNLNFG
eukprot:c43971_g1_i1 orf=1-360(-)